MKYLLYTAFLFFAAAVAPLAAESSTSPTATQSDQTAQAPAGNQVKQPMGKSEKQEKTALPTEYRSIRLGMDIDAVKEALKQDAVFGYRGERDVSLLPTENRSLIESAGSYFISRSWFQFYKDNLYTMIFKLNTDTVDYY